MIETNNEPIDLQWHALADDEIHQFDEKRYFIVRGALDSSTISKFLDVGDRLMASDRRVNRYVSHSELYDSF
jgi:hypothetical protein